VKLVPRRNLSPNEITPVNNSGERIKAQPAKTLTSYRVVIVFCICVPTQDPDNLASIKVCYDFHRSSKIACYIQIKDHSNIREENKHS